MASLGGFYGFSPDPSWSSFHPVGNCPPVDLTEGLRLPPSPELLLLGCGDIRSVLYTCHVLHTTCPPSLLPGALHFHLNDIEAGILARDLLLLRLASSGESTHEDSEDFRFLWSVWYECLLRSDHATRLRDLLVDLIGDVTRYDVISSDDVTKTDRGYITGRPHDDARKSHFKDVTNSDRGDFMGCHQDDPTQRQPDDVTRVDADHVTSHHHVDATERQSTSVKKEQRADGKKSVQFRVGNDATRSAMKEALEKYSQFSMEAVQVLKGRNELIMDITRASDFVVVSTERIASVFQEQQGCMKDPQLRMRCRKEIEGFVRTGLTSVPWSTQIEAELRRDYTGNATYFRPGIPNWIVIETACVFLSRDLDLSASGYDGRETTLSSLFFRQMVEHVRSFQALQRQGVQMTFTFWHGEALELSNSLLPASLKFDVINTSNLVDNVGLLSLLVMYSGRLRPETGLLTTQTFFYAGERSYAEYIQKQIPAVLTLFPTILGVTFAGEEKVAKCTTFRLGSFVGREATQFYWKATPRPSEKVDVSEGDLQTALRAIFLHCAVPQQFENFFRLVDSGMQTFLLLIRNFCNRVECGVDNAKELIHRLYPSDAPSKALVDPILPSLHALTILHQKELGYRTNEKIVEVFLPVEVVTSKQDLHQCTMTLLPYNDITQLLFNPGAFSTASLPITVKDFTFEFAHKRIRFFLPERVWQLVTERHNAFFTSVKVGMPSLLSTVKNVKKVARVVPVSVPSEKTKERSSQEDKKTSPATRQGIKAVRLVENEDHFLVTIQSSDALTLSKVRVQSGRKHHQVKVTSKAGGKNLVWKADLSCNVMTKDATVQLQGKGSLQAELRIPKDPLYFGRMVLDHRAIDARNLESYVFNSGSELTLYLHFWRMFPGEKKLVAEEGLLGEFFVAMATRDLMLEVMHVAIHKPEVRVVTVEVTSFSEKLVQLALELHGFKVLDGSPTLIVTVVYPFVADALCKTGRLRPRDFHKVVQELLAQPRHVIEASTLQISALPLLVDRLSSYKGRLKQDPLKDDKWIFQSFIRPNHISLSWLAHYTEVSCVLGDTSAATDLALRACHQATNAEAYTWCCPRDSFSAMCLKCLLASGRDFHHMKKNTAEAVKELTSLGVLIHQFVTVDSQRASFCAYCKSQQKNPHKCLRCLQVGYCSEECRELDSKEHVKNCDPTGKNASRLLDAATTSVNDEDELTSLASIAPFPTAMGKIPQGPEEIGPAKKEQDASSVSWWKPGMKIQKSAPKDHTAGAKTDPRDSREVLITGKSQSSNVRGHDSASKSATKEDSSISWWTSGKKLQSSAGKGPEPSSKTEPGKPKIIQTKDDDQKAHAKGHKPAQMSTAATSSTSAKVQSLSSQSSINPPGEERPAGSERPAATCEAILEERGIRRCGVCGKTSGHLKRCGRCKTGSYCSTECQTRAWKEHRKSCSAI